MMSALGDALVTGSHDAWSSSVVQIAAIHDHYVPGVRPSGDMDLSRAMANNGAANGAVNGFDSERQRLEAELATVRARTVAARREAEAHDAAARAALSAELAAARDRIAEIERIHQEAVSIVRASARSESERVLAEARRVAANLDDEAASRERTTTADGE
jgi:hypothetical protein